MDDEPRDRTQAIADHIRGAIVRTRTPFSSLAAPEPVPWDREFWQTWAAPFYGADFCHRYRKAEAREAFAACCIEASPDIVTRLLRARGWRERGVGAWLVAVRRSDDFHPLIVPLFLQSEVCYAGLAYVLAFVRSRSSASIDALERYCGYYLTRSDLDFDQAHAFAALVELLGVGDARITALLPAWDAWTAARPHRSTLDRARERLAGDLDRLAQIDAIIALRRGSR